MSGVLWCKCFVQHFWKERLQVRSPTISNTTLDHILVAYLAIHVKRVTLCLYLAIRKWVRGSSKKKKGFNGATFVLKRSCTSFRKMVKGNFIGEIPSPHSSCRILMKTFLLSLSLFFVHMLLDALTWTIFWNAIWQHYAINTRST